MFVWQPVGLELKREVQDNQWVRWADGIPTERDRMIATGINFNETGTLWEGCGP